MLAVHQINSLSHLPLSSEVNMFMLLLFSMTFNFSLKLLLKTHMITILYVVCNDRIKKYIYFTFLIFHSHKRPLRKTIMMSPAMDMRFGTPDLDLGFFFLGKLFLNNS